MSASVRPRAEITRRERRLVAVREAEAKIEARAEGRDTVEQSAYEEKGALRPLQRIAQRPCLGISFATLTLRMNLTALTHCALAYAALRNRQKFRRRLGAQRTWANACQRWIVF